MDSFKKTYQIRSHSGPIYAAASDSKNELLFTGGSDRIVGSWNLENGAQLPMSIRMEESIYSLKHFGNLLFIGDSKGGIHIVDTVEKKELRHLKVHENGIFDLFIDETGEILIAAGGDGVLSCWNLSDLSLIKLLKVSNAKIRKVIQVSDQGIFAGCGEGKIHRVNSSDLTLENSFVAHEGSVYSLAWHAKKNRLLSGGKDGHIRVWEIGKDTSPLSIPAHKYAIYDLLFIGNSLVSASRDGAIKIWSSDSLEVTQKLDLIQSKGHHKSVNKLTPLSSGKGFVSVSDDPSFIRWSPT